MYLKRLEMFGFKSFAEKTELEFTPGITAVVGPNGAGKSNVADAIRWVLGEQSARVLRGSNMADVIFAGSDGRKAMGFAQVSLVLDNSDGKLGVGFSEVMITRRVDRSGEGEYFINQVPCRLKDVQDLFMDTGLGKESYSIIGQGKIDEILSSKPEDRRAIFEEAAGISKYKSRKREAQRRLTETEQNLVRINDIIGELAAQLASLKEQAERAEQYQALQGELNRLEIGLLARNLTGVLERLSRQEERNRQLRQRRQELAEQVQACEEAAEVARNLAASLDQELAVIGARLAEATGQLQRAESRLALARQEQAAAEAEGARLDGELATLASKLQALEAEATQLAAKLAAAQQELEAAARELSDREKAHRAATDSVAELLRRTEEHKSRIIDLLQREAEARNAAAAAERSGAEADRRLARLEAERRRAEAEAAAVRSALEAVQAEQQALAAERQQVVETMTALRRAREEADQRLQQLQRQQQALREQLRGASSRLGVIEEMISGFEGYQRGPRTILQAREKGLPFAAEVLGAVAEVIRTEPRLERAIEVALGGGLQYIITATDAGAKQAIEYLKRTHGGRATFLPLNTIRPQLFRPEEERQFAGAPGILGVALDLVRFEERFRPAIAALLGRVLIAEDLDAALALNKRAGMRFRIVTLDGEVLAAGGALTGGSLGGQAPGLLSRQREREELTARIASLRQEIGALEDACRQAAAARDDLEQQIQAESARLQDLDSRIAQAEAKAARLTAENSRWSEALRTFEVEAGEIRREAEEGRETARQRLADWERLRAERSTLEEEVARLGQEVQQRTAVRDQAAQALIAVQVRLAELKEQVRGLGSQRLRLDAERSALEGERSVRQQQRAEAAVRLERALAEIGAAEAEAAEAARARDQAEAERSRVQSRKMEVLEQINARERELRSLRRAQGEVQAHLQEGEVEEARLRAEQEGLTQRLAEQYGVHAAEAPGLALAEEEVAFARTRIQALRDQIRDLGPVNLQAIDEYRSTRERYEFLQQQRADLEEAKASLYRAVAELDKRIKSQFLESFQVVRREFQRVFQELFGGGRADLQLLDESDLLETGVEIIAQPPGKKLQPLSLLSGGERAMTAIALLFALLRVRPAPFVVLDEVEAALDEANVERVARYLKSYAEEGCQFICITHQRGTMEVADTLYGVTMEGNGVSKVVSVRLADVQQEAV